MQHIQTNEKEGRSHSTHASHTWTPPCIANSADQDKIMLDLRLQKGRAVMKHYIKHLAIRTLPVSIVTQLPTSKLSLAHYYLNLGHRRGVDALIAEHFRDDPNLSYLIAIDRDKTTGEHRAKFPIERIADTILSNLIDYDPPRLSRIEKTLNVFGFFHLGSIVRTCLLINIANIELAKERKDKTLFRALIEIAASDYGHDFIFERELFPNDYQNLMRLKMEEIATWGRDEMVSLFLEEGIAPKSLKINPIDGSLAFLQGPSVRKTNLAPSDAHLISAPAYSGPSSLASTCGRVDVSLYRRHKLDKMLESGLSHTLRQLSLIVLTSKSAEPFFGEDLRFWLKTKYNAVESRVEADYCGSTLNAGTEFLLFLLASGAKGVSVANVDLFLNGNYPIEYISNRPSTKRRRRDRGYCLDKQSMLQLFGYHSPGQQLAVYKLFQLDCGVIYDDFMSEVVSMRLSDYMEALEKTYRET